MKVLHAAFFHLHVTREKLPKRFLYEKGALETLMKLTPGFEGGLTSKPDESYLSATSWIQYFCHVVG